MRGRVGVAMALPGSALACMALLAACAGDPPPANRGDAAQPSLVASAAASGDVPADTLEMARLRQRMVDLIARRDVGDTAVLRAMGEVPRHRFVPDAPPAAAYGDHPLPIGHGQTISQPYIVAFMAQAAEMAPGDRVLEIGTGSGYGAAVLAEVVGPAGAVHTIEIVPELARQAEAVLAELGYGNVHVRAGNGWLGWPEHAPWDAVVVTAAPDRVPEALVEQLAVGGLIVVPVGDVFQLLRVLRKTDDGLVEEGSLPVRFVPMVGEPGDTVR